MRFIRTGRYLVVALALSDVSAHDAFAQAPEMVRLSFLEQDSAGGPDTLPLVRALSPSDTRWREGERLANNEAARFARQLVAAAWRLTGKAGPLPPLSIVIIPGGNSAARGFRVRRAGPTIEQRPDEPYIKLDLRADRFRVTLLHEAGHVAQMIVQGRERKEPPWSAAPHSTFAVTDRTTAVAEGYAIQLEAVWAHFGRDSAQRAFYHRLRPPDVRGTSAAFYFPANDLLNFAQTWGRYAAVRDGLAAFEAHAYDGDLVRSQYDPARDRSTLRRPSAMVASEGVAASTLFWAGSEYATLRGAKPGGGLGLSVLMAQREILRAMRTSVGAADMWRPDLIDVITSFGENGSRDRRNAIGRFVDVTKGVTALPSLRLTWATFYHGAIRLDFDATARATATLDSARAEIASAALTDESMLRRGLGPVLPVRADNLGFRLVAFGNATSVELDLNAVSEPELRALPRVDDVMRQQIRAALDRAPFVSVADFETRVGRPLAALGLTVVPVSRHE